MERVERIERCRSCGSRHLKEVLSLGKISISNFLEESDESRSAPLSLVLCEKCYLLQLRHTVDPRTLYREYWYRSGMNESMIESLHDIVVSVREIKDIDKSSIVTDIGCNDGTLLSFYPEKSKRVGFEPAENIYELAEEKSDLVINSFFNQSDYFKNLSEKSDVITAIAMFYDLDSPNEFLRNVHNCLKDDGLFIIEQRYLPSMIEQNDIGNICHEHLEYYSLTSLEHLLDRHKFEIFDVETNNVNGGSFRTYIRKKGSSTGEKREHRLSEMREKESDMKSLETYEDFAHRCEENKRKIRSFLENKKRKGRTIHVYGASTKGNTMLQYWGTDKDIISAAAEKDERKFGKRTVETDIPIIPEERSREEANIFLVLPFHFLDVFLEKERDFLDRGGEFLVPLPYPRLITNEKERRL